MRKHTGSCSNSISLVPRTAPFCASISARRVKQGRDLPIRVVAASSTAEFAGLLDGVETWDEVPTMAQIDGFAAEVEAADHFA